jgi:hypothetical protein
MKTKQLFTIAIVFLIATGLMAPAWSQKAGNISDSRNLFESAGPETRSDRDFVIVTSEFVQ